MESLQAFDTVLRHERAMQRDWAIVGRSHLTSAGAVPLGAGLEIWKGYKQSARPCQGGLHLVVDRAACAFVKAQPVLNLVADVANLRGAAELARVQLVFGSRQWKAVSKVVKGFRVMKLHFPGQKRKATVKGLSKRSASEETFLDSELGRQVSVAQYFARKYKPLQYPHLPCLQVVGKSELLPLEVCDIVKGQRKTLLTDGDLSAKMIKVTASHPNDRWQQIEGTVSDVISRDATVRQFNIDVDRHMVSLTGRVLPPPTLLYAGNKQVTPTDGSWDRSMSKLQLLEAPPKPLDRWAIVNFENGITAAQCGIVGNELRLMMKRHNFRGVPEAAVEIVAPRESVAATLNRAVSKRYQLAVVILPQFGGDDLRKEVKFHMEYAGANSGASMLTSCMRAMHIFKGTGGGPQGGRGGGGRGGRGGGGGRGGRFAGRGGGASAGNNSILKPTYLSNFVLKINSKLGGVNAKIAPPAQRLTSPGLLLMEVPTMVFGADVTHPSPGSDSQSVAAVVGSTDATCTRYEAQLSAQSGRQEIIEQLNEMTQKLLLAFYRKTTKKPERIVFFRDGVSEGQFQHCLAQELPQIKEACRAVSNDDGYNPQVTFVIVQKRHMTRLFAADAKDTDASGNVRAGTVVDRTITHPSEYDFFLQSHAGIQGTTKPSHYHVIWDEIGIPPDTLQQFSYSLCHLYARCPRSVSLPAPVVGLCSVLAG